MLSTSTCCTILKNTDRFQKLQTFRFSWPSDDVPLCKVCPPALCQNMMRYNGLSSHHSMEHLICANMHRSFCFGSHTCSVWNTGWPKKTEPTNLWIKFSNFNHSPFFSGRLSSWNTATIDFPTMSWSTKEKAFCVEAYFANNSYKLVQASFRRKFQCRHAPSESRIFDWIQKFRQYETMQNLYSKSLMDTYSGRTVSTRMQRNIDTVRDSFTTYASLTPTPWRSFGAHFGKNMTFVRGASMTKTLGNDCTQTEV